MAVAAVCSIAVVGCAGKPERADTLPGAASESKTTETTKTARQPPTVPAVPKESTLSAAQAKRALLTLDDMPTGWSQEKPDPGSDDETVTPKRCATVFDALGDRDPLSEAEASFSAGDLGPSLDHTVSSWPKSQVQALKAITQALRQCPKFTSTSKDGSSATFEATGLSFPNLGDRTLALRLKGKTDGIGVVVDVVYIAKGNNTVVLIASGLQPLEGATFEKLARTAIGRLNAAAA
ncbi:hypothetical protein [Kribbella sp. NPDC048928]|uniref:hypothetical protein n=1 Tax=Kribbella sp. NPDC048928 TaxID=3364111 RepID=UPI0037226F99